MSATTTLAPSRAKATAVARPMPFAAPVTNATLPVRFPLLFASICCSRSILVVCSAFVLVLVSKLHGDLHRTTHVEGFDASVALRDRAHCCRTYRLHVLVVVVSEPAIRRP